MDTRFGNHESAPASHPASESNQAERTSDREPAHQELDDNEGADAFETEDSVRTTRRTSSSERQDEELISLDPPD